MPADLMAPPMPAKPPMVAPGSTAPATVAPMSEGLKMRAMIIVGPALKDLEKALSLLGSQSEEGQTLVKALGLLGKTFGSSVGADLTRAEAKMRMESTPAVSTPNRSAIEARLKQMGIGGQSQSPSPSPEAAPPMAGAGA